jgi:hypothetical protein
MPLLLSYNRFTCLQVDTIITPEICNIESNQVVQTISHPPNSNQCNRLLAWEYWLPSKYVIASSPGSMSLSVNVEIEAMDTVVKQCTWALVDCRVIGCFIDIDWVKLNNILTCPLTNAVLVYNVNSIANEAAMITEIADLCQGNSPWLVVSFSLSIISPFLPLPLLFLSLFSMILVVLWHHSHITCNVVILLAAEPKGSAVGYNISLGLTYLHPCPAL